MEIPAGYAQANFRFTGTGAGQGAEFTLGLDIGGYPDDPSDLVADLAAIMTAEITPLLTNAVNNSEILVKFGPTATGPSATGPGGGVGASSSTATSPNVSYLIHKQTALGGRAGRGRLYLPGVGEDKVDGAGNVLSTFITTANSAFADFGSAVALLGAIPVVLHSPGSPISIPTPITGFAMDAKVATQRRRLRG